MIMHLMEHTTRREILATPTPETLFRGNSIATKLIDVYMKMIGFPYLHKTLQHLIRPIFALKKAVELDPSKIEKGEDPARNAKVLIEYIDSFLSSIFQSLDDCPSVLKCIFAHMRKQVEERFQDHPDLPTVRHTVVSSMIFLRFFVPAILNPKLFEMMEDFANEKASRTLTLIAKTIQNLANLVEFGEKESYMLPLNATISHRIPDMQAFLEAISQTSDSFEFSMHDCSDSEPIWLEKELATIHHIISDNFSTIEQHCDLTFVSLLKDCLSNIDIFVQSIS